MRLSLFLSSLALLSLLGTLGCDETAPDFAEYPLVVSGKGIGSDTPRGRLLRMSLDGETVPLFGFGESSARAPVCDASGQRVAFEGGRGGSSHTWALWMLEDGRERPLAEADGRPVNGLLGGWAPDGRRVIVSQGQYDASLSIVDVETGSVTSLTSGIDDDREPVWSRDGERIAFLSTRGSDAGSEVFVIAPDGYDLQQVTASPDSSRTVDQVTWGPGPSEITYRSISYSPGGPDAYTTRIVDVVTGGERSFPDLRLPEGARGPHYVRWSPDGSRAVFMALQFDGERRTGDWLMLYDARSGEVTTLLERPYNGGGPLEAAWCAP